MIPANMGNALKHLSSIDDSLRSISRSIKEVTDALAARDSETTDGHDKGFWENKNIC